jgi:hypothetical protein
MAKRTGGFNLSEAIRDYQKAHPKATANEALAAVKANHPKLNDATFRSTFYKLKGGGKKRSVRRKKPGRGGAEGGWVLPAAVAFIRAAGGMEQAKQVLSELEAVRQL